MTITATQTKSEFARNSLRTFYVGGSGKMMLLLGMGMIVLYLGLLVWSLIKGSDLPAIYLPVAGIGILTLMPALIYRKASMAYDSNPAINQPITYTFTEQGVGTKGAGFDSQMSWDQIFRVSEQREAILLFYSQQIANPIPKRNFTEAQLQTLRDLVESIPGLTSDMA